MNKLTQLKGVKGHYQTVYVLCVLLFLFAGLPLQAQFNEVSRFRQAIKS